MTARILVSLAFAALLVGCASVPVTAAYHRQFSRLKTREAKAEFAFDLMAKKIITPPAEIETVFAVFGKEDSREVAKDGVCTVEFFLNDTTNDFEQSPPSWILRIEHASGSSRIDSCALIAPNIGK